MNALANDSEQDDCRDPDDDAKHSKHRAQAIGEQRLRHKPHEILHSHGYQRRAKARTGSSLAARLAGITPKAIPRTRATIKAPASA